MDHHGCTAGFAINETFDKIQAKLESAQRRQQEFKFGNKKREENGPPADNQGNGKKTPADRINDDVEIRAKRSMRRRSAI